MRFRQVELVNIPETGLFAIEGANETGKSTIGHLIAFALSGKLPAHYSSPIDLINWEKGSCKVELQFRFEEDQFEIQRQIDRDGSVFAQIRSGEDVLAQGIAEVRKKLTHMLGYSPAQLSRTFLIDHDAIQALNREAPVQHVEEMLEVNRVRGLVEHAVQSQKDLSHQLSDFEAQYENINRELNEVGYTEEEEQRLYQQKEQSQVDIEKAQAQLNHKIEHQDQLKQQLDRLESEIQLIEENSKNKDLDVMDRELKQRLQKLEQLELSEKANSGVETAKEQLSSVLQYHDQSTELSQQCRDKLQGIKEKIGEDEESQTDSLKRQEHLSDLSMNRTRRNLSFSSWCFLILLFTIGGGLAAYIERQPLLDRLKQSDFLVNLSESQLKEAWNYIETVFRPGDQGWPTHQHAWLWIGGLGGCLLLFLVLTVSLSKKLKQQKSKHQELLENTKALKDSYDQLNAADFNEMKEAADIIQNSQFPDLKELLSDFKSKNPLLVERDYKLEIVLQGICGHLREASQSQSLELHRARDASELAGEELGAKKKTLQDLEPQIEDIEQKKEKHLELFKQSKEIEYERDALKREHKRLACLQTLGEGCHESLLGRLRHDFVSIYKALLPKITDSRYASIKLDEEFRLQVFSEERGDFVTLKQLSSGTHDLMTLIFHLVLMEGSMQARNMKRHFIFLDEPLLSVDGERYQKLCHLLPQLSKRMGQIFLCRPPGELSQFHVVRTEMGLRDLRIDFSSL